MIIKIILHSFSLPSHFYGPTLPPLPTKLHLVKAMVFPVVMYRCELDYKESWALKNWCFWTVVLEKTLESPLDSKVIRLVNPKGNQSWIFIGRTDAEAEAPILWPPDTKNWLIRKDPDAGENWRQEEKGATEDEMVGCIPDSVDMSLSTLWETVKDWEAWRATVHGVAESNMTWRRSNIPTQSKKYLYSLNSYLTAHQSTVFHFFPWPIQLLPI